MAITLDEFLNKSATIGLVKDKKVNREYTEILRDGIYKSYDNGAMSITEKVLDIPKGILRGGVASQETGFQVHKKLPFEIFNMILQLFYDITGKTRQESSVLVYRNVNNVEIPKTIKDSLGDALVEIDDFVVLVPSQKNTIVHSSFVEKGTYNYQNSDIAWFHDNLVGVVETHSHNTMNAFWSGEDNLHERSHTKLRMFLVYGTLDQVPTFRLRYVYNEEFTDNLPLGTLFELPTVKYESVSKETVMVAGKEIVLHESSELVEDELDVEEYLSSIDLENEPFDYPVEAWQNQCLNTSIGKTYKDDTENEWEVGIDVEDLEEESLEEDEIMENKVEEKVYGPLNYEEASKQGLEKLEYIEKQEEIKPTSKNFLGRIFGK